MFIMYKLEVWNVPKYQPETKKENMGFCHPPKTHKNNTFKLGDPTL
jgi:hypothetical protein